MELYRPYPPPTGPFVMHQAWHDLLFLHWRIEPHVMHALVPPQLPLDTFHGGAYVGVIPFMMRNVRPRGVPPVPWLSFFPELNVRTYVTLDGRPGVYFFSLDAANPVAVEIARGLFHLPYENATMECVRTEPTPFGPAVHYASTRTDRRAPPAYFRAEYAPTGAPFIAARGSLEYFLTARYCLYTLDGRGNVLRGEIDHPPWALQPAAVRLETNTMTQPIALALPDAPPHVLFASELNVIVWLPHHVNSVL